MTTLSNDNATSSPAEDMRADLEAAFEASQEPTEEVVTTEEPSTAETPSEEPPEPSTEEPSAEESKPEDGPEAKPAETIKAPASWKPEFREKFAELPQELRDEINRVETAAGQQFRQNADARKIAENFKATLDPYMDMIQAQGSNPYAAVKEVLEVAKRLNTGTSAQKAELLGELFMRHGVELNDLDVVLTKRLQAPQPTSAEKAILERLDRMERARTAPMPQANPEPDTETVNKSIEAFAADPKNEFFNDVQQDMATLLTIGKAKSLEEAYDKAVKMSDEVQKVLADRKAKDKQRATAGNVSVKGSAPKAKPVVEKELSLRDTLSKLYDENMGG